MSRCWRRRCRKRVWCIGAVAAGVDVCGAAVGRGRQTDHLAWQKEGKTNGWKIMGATEAPKFVGSFRQDRSKSSNDSKVTKYAAAGQERTPCRTGAPNPPRQPWNSARHQPSSRLPPRAPSIGAAPGARRTPSKWPTAQHEEDVLQLPRTRPHRELAGGAYSWCHGTMGRRRAALLPEPNCFPGPLCMIDFGLATRSRPVLAWSN